MQHFTTAYVVSYKVKQLLKSVLYRSAFLHGAVLTLNQEIYLMPKSCKLLRTPKSKAWTSSSLQDIHE